MVLPFLILYNAECRNWEDNLYLKCLVWRLCVYLRWGFRFLVWVLIMKWIPRDLDWTNRPSPSPSDPKEAFTGYQEAVERVGNTRSRALRGQRQNWPKQRRRVPILPCWRFPNVRAEVKLQFPLEIEMSLLKMISPVINGAVCVLRIVSLPPSTPHTGLWECPSKRAASRGGQYSLFGAPGTNDWTD